MAMLKMNIAKLITKIMTLMMNIAILLMKVAILRMNIAVSITKIVILMINIAILLMKVAILRMNIAMLIIKAFIGSAWTLVGRYRTLPTIQILIPASPRLCVS